MEGTQIELLPEWISELRDLELLDLRRTGLQFLPGSLKELHRLEWLLLHGNPKLGLADEIFGEQDYIDGQQTPPKNILSAYFASQRAASPLREVKMVILGRGEAGKTTIVDYLRSGTWQAHHEETLGVELADWTVNRAPLPGPVTAHIWDFAGQQEAHGAHAYFLTPRTVYVLVLAGRRDDAEEDAVYWLDLVQQYGSERRGGSGAPGITSPVIVCLHQWDNKKQSRPEVERQELREKYPFIRAFVETDCLTGRGMEQLQDEIAMAVASIDGVEQAFPAEWWAVKEALSHMRRELDRDYLSYADYETLCAQKGVRPDDIGALASILNRLGIALNYADDDRLRETTILNPGWLTSGIYRLLRRAPDDSGILTRERAAAELADPQTREPMEPRMADFLLRLMVRYGLAFDLRSDDEAETGQTDERLLVPQRLPLERPQSVESFWLERDGRPRQGATRLRYCFSVLPENLVPRFIARRHLLCPSQQWWRRGMVLELGGARALVRADRTARLIEIIVVPPEPPVPFIEWGDRQQDLAGMIVDTWRDILRQSGLCPVEELEVAKGGLWQPLRGLEEAEKADLEQVPMLTSSGVVPVEVTRELNKLTEPPARDGSWKPRLFISYSHKDEKAREYLEICLSVARTNGKLSIWQDRMLEPGGLWNEKIASEIRAADIFIFLASEYSLASDYIRNREVPLALELEAAGRQKFVAVVLRPCRVTDWNTEVKLPDGKTEKVWLKDRQMLPRDGVSHPISTYSPRARGWDLVARELTALCESLRETQSGKRVL